MHSTPESDLVIRPMDRADLEPYLSLRNRVYPTRTRTVEEVLEGDRRRAGKVASGRWAVLVDDRLIAGAAYVQWSVAERRDWFQMNIIVDEAFRRRGIGTSLFARLFEDARRHGPRVLRADAYENLPAGLPFAQSLGFADVFREAPTHLDLDAFDPAPFKSTVARLKQEGVESISYAEYRGRDPGFAEPLFSAYREAWADVPKEEEIDLNREDWMDIFLHGSAVDFDTSTVALKGNRIVGFCEIGTAPGGRPVYAGLAGVARDSRGRGVSTTTHVRSIDAVRRKGHPQIQTSSAIENIAMQTVYRKLGFQREPVWIQMEKRLEPTS
jgi:GNAT superfamily N-acetyltransferase